MPGSGKEITWFRLLWCIKLVCMMCMIPMAAKAAHSHLLQRSAIPRNWDLLIDGTLEAYTNFQRVLVFIKSVNNKRTQSGKRFWFLEETKAAHFACQSLWWIDEETKKMNRRVRGPWGGSRSQISPVRNISEGVPAHSDLAAWYWMEQTQARQQDKRFGVRSVCGKKIWNQTPLWKWQPHLPMKVAQFLKGLP